MHELFNTLRNTHGGSCFTSRPQLESLRQLAMSECADSEDEETEEDGLYDPEEGNDDDLSEDIEDTADTNDEIYN